MPAMPRKKPGRPALQVKRHTLGAKIAAARARAGLSQDELSFRLGCPQQSVSFWERNIRKPPRNAIKPLAELLGLSVEELL